MNSEEVARYLKDHPEFFEEYADLLGSIYIPHPHGGRAIPLSERQMLTLREKSKVLEGKLRQLVQFGEENDSIGERLHRVTLALLNARDVSTLLDTLYANLQRDFAIPAVTVRAWPNMASAGGFGFCFCVRDFLPGFCGGAGLSSGAAFFGAVSSLAGSLLDLLLSGAGLSSGWASFFGAALCSGDVGCSTLSGCEASLIF